MLCTMPNNAVIRGPEAPQLVVMDLLGVFMENDHAVKGAIAASFQAHGQGPQTKSQRSDQTSS